ncbi:hypothetical protein LSAT2_019275 [Lamellibrachia satsuma]|nr:hypothetical protein LSAT2_019275 [Lamellibrachia satsuma]
MDTNAGEKMAESDSDTCRKKYLWCQDTCTTTLHSLRLIVNIPASEMSKVGFQSNKKNQQYGGPLVCAASVRTQNCRLLDQGSPPVESIMKPSSATYIVVVALLTVALALLSTADDKMAKSASGTNADDKMTEFDTNSCYEEYKKSMDLSQSTCYARSRPDQGSKPVEFNMKKSSAVYITVVALTIVLVRSSTADVNLAETDGEANVDDKMKESDSDTKARDKMEDFARHSNADDKMEEPDSDTNADDKMEEPDSDTNADDDNMEEPDSDTDADDKMEEPDSDTDADDKMEEPDSDTAADDESHSDACYDEHSMCEELCITDKHGLELLSCLARCLKQYVDC